MFGPGLLADFNALSKNDWNFVSSLLDPNDLAFVVIVDGTAVVVAVFVENISAVVLCMFRLGKVRLGKVRLG